MNEIIFLVEESDEGGYTARAINEAIFTEGDTLDDVRRNVREAVECQFRRRQGPNSHSAPYRARGDSHCMSAKI
jgi:hypothetical protein